MARREAPRRAGHLRASTSQSRHHTNTIRAMKIKIEIIDNAIAPIIAACYPQP